eukprot:356191-Chlamydomonas_euryale.AAC.6
MHMNHDGRRYQLNCVLVFRNNVARVRRHAACNSPLASYRHSRCPRRLGQYGAWHDCGFCRMGQSGDCMAASPGAWGSLVDGMAAHPGAWGSLVHGMAAHPGAWGSLVHGMAARPGTCGSLVHGMAARPGAWGSVAACGARGLRVWTAATHLPCSSSPFGLFTVYSSCIAGACRHADKSLERVFVGVGVHKTPHTLSVTPAPVLRHSTPAHGQAAGIESSTQLSSVPPLTDTGTPATHQSPPAHLAPCSLHKRTGLAPLSCRPISEDRHRAPLPHSLPRTLAQAAAHPPAQLSAS